MKHMESFYGEDNFAEAAQPAHSELAAQIRSGNNEAFGELWLGLVAGIRTTAQRNGTAYQDLDDAVSDVTVKLLEALQERTLDFKNGAHAYANGMARNQAIDRWRRRSFRGEVLADDLSAATPHAAYNPQPKSPEEIVVSAMTSESTVNEILSHVKPDRRDPMLAVYVDGYSATEYAEATGMPRGTVLSKSHRGREEARAHPEIQNGTA